MNKNRKKEPALFQTKEKKKPFSCRLSPVVLGIIKSACLEHSVSASEVIEGCVKYVLAVKKDGIKNQRND